MKRDVVRFIDDFSSEIEAGNAAIFAGAGLSVPAGFVDWRELLRPLAEELDLQIERETDLVSVAQFHVNANGNNRHRLHRAIIEALSVDEPPTENHKLLARLPIATWWTTNYDNLIETSLRAAGKIVDVKSAVPQLADTRPRRDAIVYKMHGDVGRPDEAIVTRDDYERYTNDRGPFITALAGDLISKTFLFVGFSFTDPNLDHVLSRMRISFAFKGGPRRHYAIFKTRTRLVNEDEEAFQHAVIRQQLVLQDLKRFNVIAVLIDSYEELEQIVKELERRYRRRTIFVGASASNFEPWGEHAVSQFMRSLGAALIETGARVSTGLGLGVGNALFTGAVEAVTRSKDRHIEDALVIRPFPQAMAPAERAVFWEKYRQEIISQAGIALFLFGNKDTVTGPALADGLRREFEIAREHGLILLPIGATGSMAAELASELLANGDQLKAGLDPDAWTEVEAIAKPVDDLQNLIKPIAQLVSRLKVGGQDMSKRKA